MKTRNKTYLEKILEFEKKNPDYWFEREYESFHEQNSSLKDVRYHSGVEHSLRFLIAPVERTYSISRLNEFVKFFEEQIGFEEKDGENWNHNFYIEGKSKFFSDTRRFYRANKHISEFLDMKLSLRETNTLSFEVNDKYLLKNENEKFKKFLGVDKINPGKNIKKTSETKKLRREGGIRKIELSFFPNEYMPLQYVHNLNRVVPYAKSSTCYTWHELSGIIGEENCNKIFDSSN